MGIAHAAGIFSIHDAIHQASQTNPGVGEATANRRATEAELRQRQGTLLPQVRLEARTGPEKLTRFVSPTPTGNGEWRNGREVSIVARQLLFDGFASVNEIWRDAARVDAAAYRVRERTELIALDAAEAYIDVVRYMRLIGLAQENLNRLRKIAGDVRQRFSGGRAGEGDQQLAVERVAAAEAVLAEFRRSLEDARARYRNVVGLEPYNVRFPGRLARMPNSKDDALAVALRHNPTIQAAQADATAAKYGFRATAGAFVPTVSLEGRASRGTDTENILGVQEDVSGKLVVSWDIFRGGQDAWKRSEMADRMIESNMRHARLQRDAFESLDKAWAARTITSDRIVSLARQVDAARKVVSAYRQEYELDKRTLFDLLNAENEFFNAAVSLVSARGVAVFADYQLLAAMGQLLDYLKTPAPVEADPLDVKPFLLFPTKLPPVIIKDPGQPGPEPLKVASAGVVDARAEAVDAVPANPPKVMSFGDRWSEGTGTASSVKGWFAQVMPGTAPEHQKTAGGHWSRNVSGFTPIGVQLPLP